MDRTGELAETAEITDPKLLARIRCLIRQEHAGFLANGDGHPVNACLEPGCSCNFDVCGPFRNVPVRCTSFETNVLPLAPDLEASYWAHLRQGTVLHVRRCAWPNCRREVGAANAKYCGPHALFSTKRSKRDHARRRRAARKRRGVEKVPSAALDNQASPTASRRFLTKRYSLEGGSR